jgi:hypothetical protein
VSLAWRASVLWVSGLPFSHNLVEHVAEDADASVDVLRLHAAEA